MKTKQNIRKLTNFEIHLREELEDPEFKRLYDQFGRQLEIAYQILQLRKKAKISQAELAKKIGTTQSNIARLEAGNQNFTTATLEKIARVFKRELRIEFV